MRLTVPVICCALLLGSASLASAQAEHRLGLVIGVPTAAGIQWQINDRIAVRGDADFNWNRVEQFGASISFGGGPGGSSTTTMTTRSRSSVASAGVSTLVTLSRREQLRLYLAPRLAWQTVRSSFTTDTISQFGGTSTGASTRSTSTVMNGVQVDGMFGANYRVGDRFSVYGETGLSLTTPTASSSSPTDQVKSYSFGLRSNVGVVLHF